ncbi:hypothetical protein PE074_06940 [Wohlfahrtiimonas chitiniclastica]|uniref:Outer membrane lipoprotein SlyB n=2 Tax=Wohlfahrtiimonas chitiniclastica TaxID=400946 RepID=L8XXA6_9GAMM|nr:glycine zipper 2TM domain-containing protein [Wohlfahrtiimonas chitiniclastica]ELV08668.1 Outer membrane lipoprotein SlyB [Wohlfahrtiimonas chitiniclastica SH04]KZS22320.1 hypothetical protein BMY_0140 [Wohlfahrtiimonas chitiniclastica]KZX37858.1 hypothetical protein A6V30_02980 [Wohlfahrtiimonas chitiniclastica]MBS7814072.1 hypothetical protein [Wohlfahrtiimonas chitiniclastica]MBS7816334.1 hypothetical protein [Wohlfahrtiimonas chitiniclastica]
MNLRQKALVLMVASVFVTGCASSLSGDSYSRSEARQAQTVQIGTVVSTRPVKIEGTKTGLGAVTGGALGGVAANSIGGGRGKALATIAGAAVGVLAGAAAEEGMTKSQGVEILVTLDGTHTTRAYVQAADGTQFYAGQRVSITTTREGTSRVNPI